MSRESAEKIERKPEALESVSARRIEKDAMDQGAPTAFDDSKFLFKNGKEGLIRTYHNRDQDMLRVFDDPTRAPDRATTTPAYLNLTHMRDEMDGTIERTKINDLFVPESLRGEGVGSELLKSGEANARAHGSEEIYGQFVPDQVGTRDWYLHRGYSFRPSEFGGEEVYKRLI